MQIAAPFLTPENLAELWCRGGRSRAEDAGKRGRQDEVEVAGSDYKLKSSRSRRVWVRLTGTSVCALSFMRNW